MSGNDTISITPDPEHLMEKRTALAPFPTDDHKAARYIQGNMSWNGQ